MKDVYNTGKVKIGERYEAPARYTASQDMERLQSALLGAKSHDWSGIIIASVCSLAVLAILIPFWSR